MSGNLIFSGINVMAPRPQSLKSYGILGDLSAWNYSDLNSDGFLDYVVLTGEFATQAPAVGTALGVFLNSSAGTFDYVNPVVGEYIGGLHPRKLIIVELNNDGIDDFVIADHGYDLPPFPGAEPRVFLSNDGNLNWTDQSELFAGFQGFHHAVSSADFNGDGYNDLLFSPDTGIFINKGGADFQLDNRWIAETTILADPYYTSEIADVDGDGYFDILIGGHEFQDAETRIYWGAEDGIFREEDSFILPAVSGYGVVIDIDVADFDSDGKNEIMLNRAGSAPENSFYEGGAKFQMLEMVDRSTFEDVSSEAFSANLSTFLTYHYPNLEIINWVHWLRPFDLDSDGDLDLFIDDGNLWMHRSVLLNDGFGHFTLVDGFGNPVPELGGYSLTAIANVFGSIMFLDGLTETVTSSSHTIEYQGTSFNYAEVDAIITTVIRDGEFTSEFAAEIAESFPDSAGISYSTAVTLLGQANLESTLLTVAGADGNYVG